MINQVAPIIFTFFLKTAKTEETSKTKTRELIKLYFRHIMSMYTNSMLKYREVNSNLLCYIKKLSPSVSNGNSFFVTVCVLSKILKQYHAAAEFAGE